MQEHAPPPKRGRLRRTFGAVLATLGLGSVFALSVLASLALHVNLPPLRRIARDVTNRVLAKTLEGSVIIEDIDRIGFGEVDIRSVVALDPQGRQTIRATGIRGRIDLVQFAREAMNGNTMITLPLVHVDDAEVLLDRDADGRLGIERAFLPRPRKPSTKPTKPSTKKPTKSAIVLERIEVGHAWVHGNVAYPRVLDADVTRLVTAIRIGPDKLAIDVEPTGIRERSILHVPLAGTADYHFHLDFPAPGQTDPKDIKLRMWTGFTGHAGPVEVLARASLDGQTISAAIELPRTNPGDMARLAPGLPILEATSVRASIEGVYPHFNVDGRLDVTPREGKPASVDLAGRLDVQGGPKLVLDVTANNLNPQSFVDKAPPTEIDARARMFFTANPTPRFVVDASIEPLTVSGQSIPAIDAHVVYDELLEGRITLHEPGAPTRGTFVLERRDLIRFDAETNVASLQSMPRLGGPLAGSARVRIRGAVKDSELDARIDGNVHGLRTTKGEVSLEDGRFDGHLRGPFERLEIDALVSGEQLHAGGNAADRVTVRARGPIATPSVNAHLVGGDVEDLRASARIDPKGNAVRDVAVQLSRGGEELRGKATELKLEQGSLAARGLALEGPGLGSLGGSLVVANQEVTGKLQGKGIDLSRLGRLLGVGKRVKGIADVDVSLARWNRGRKGHVRVRVENATVVAMPGIELSGASASVIATFENERASLEASLRLEDHAKPGEDPATACDGTIAEVRISETEGNLRGPLLAPSTWANLTGKASVAAKDTRLDCLAKRLPIALLLTEVAGKLDASLSVERPAGQRFVSVKQLEVATRGLRIAGPIMFGEDKPRWESRALDIAVTGSLDGATGATSGKVVLSDTSLLGELTANIDLDLRTLIDDPKRRAESLLQSHGNVTFEIPTRSVRSLKSLPSFFHDQLPPFDGDFSVTVRGAGTLVEPVIRARASASRWMHVDEHGLPTPWTLPVEVDVLASYDTQKAAVVAQVRREGREIVSAVGHAAMDLPAFVRGGEAPTTFDVRTTLSRLPLGKLPYFAERGVEADVSGTLQYEQRGEQRTAKGRMFVPTLRIGNEVALQRAAMSLDIDPRKDGASNSHGVIQLELGGRDGGRVDTAAYAGVKWDGFVPKIDDLSAAGFSVRASGFRISSLHPFVTGVFSKLDGRLDGHLNVASTMYGDENQGHVETNMELTDGVFHIPQIGQELRNTHLSLRSRERGVLHLDDIRADGISGTIRGSATARMKGLAFQNATADFSIRKSESLPITFEGVPIGQAFGKVSLVADKRGREVFVAVKIPELHLNLPASSSRNVQSLDPHPDIMVSHAVGPVKELRQEGALAWITSVDLGELHIEGTGIDVKVKSPKESPPRIELREEARLSGDVEVTNGTFDVIGKRFEIERGLVRLREEDAGNPYVNVTARWDAPNGTRIYVDYVGVLKPITEQKLRFRSDPPLAQQAILSMILTGETQETNKEESTQGSAGAAGLAANVVGGEIASTQINAVLSQIAPLRGLSTRLGTSDSGRLQTTVMYELGDTVRAQASYEGIPNGASLEGIRTDVNDSFGAVNRTELSIDWRFYKNWMLRGSFGFGGINQQPSSGLDLLWQYRY